MKGSMCRVNVKALVIGVNPAWDERTKMLIISGITTDSDRMPHYVWASWTLPISDFHTLSVLPFARVGNFLELTSASCSFDQTDNPEVVNVRLDEPEFSEVDPMTLDKRDLESLRNFLDEHVAENEVGDCLRDNDDMSRQELLLKLALIREKRDCGR